MSFNKRILPDIEQLIKRRQEIMDDPKFLRETVGKADCLMGTKESLDYIEEIEKNLADIKK